MRFDHFKTGLMIEQIFVTIGVGAVITSFGWLIKRNVGRLDRKIDNIEKALNNKVGDPLCKERRESCGPCRYTVKCHTENLDELNTCVTRYVDDCRVPSGRR